MRRADRTSQTQSLRAARQAAEGDPGEQQLAHELRQFVEDLVSGRIDNNEEVRRLQHPCDPLDAPPVRRPRRTHRRVPPGVLTLRHAATKLEEMIAEYAPSREPNDIWHAFQRFASVPVESDGEERIDQARQLLFVEWGTSERSSDGSGGGPGFWVDLVRQISLINEHGEFVDLEQIHAEIVFDPCPELDSLGADVIFSEETSPTDDAFFAKVESSSVWNALSGSYPVVTVRVYQDPTE